MSSRARPPEDQPRERHSPQHTDAPGEPLAASAGQLFQFLEGMPVGIFVLGSDGKTRYTNGAAERILGRGIAPDARPEDLADLVERAANGATLEIPLGTSLQAAEHALIRATLAAYGGNKKRTAKALGICRRTLYHKLERL